MAESGRDLWGSCWPHLLKQPHLELLAQVCVQMAFEHLQGWRLHNLSGQLCQCLVIFRVKRASWHSSCLLSGHHWEKLGFVGFFSWLLFTSSYFWSIITDKVSLSVLMTELIISCSFSPSSSCSGCPHCISCIHTLPHLRPREVSLLSVCVVSAPCQGGIWALQWVAGRERSAVPSWQTHHHL